MTFNATKARVLNRGVPPDSFLTQIVEWGHDAKDEVFALNNNPSDIYGYVREQLGPWRGEPGGKEWFLHRKAVVCEVARVHAGFEASWNWKEGVDTTNQTSMSNKSGQETGVFQVSFNSVFLSDGAMEEFADANGIDSADKFILAMKENHTLAIEYYARLIRVNCKWAGPIIRREINRWLSRAAVAEFETLLAL